MAEVRRGNGLVMKRLLPMNPLVDYRDEEINYVHERDRRNHESEKARAIPVTISEPILDLLTDNPEIKSSLVANVSREDYGSYLIEALKEKLERDKYLT